ncbi:YitT family protein [Ihubacter sp. mB4P-1]|uniref:YitT family protein n=1 Tax=Ihubacter sp. mB4P-1 TaxID=3242370 RepID=UPI00137AADB5
MGSLEKQNKWKKEAKRFLFCTIGAVLIAFNIKSFVRTGGLFPGGFSGITLLLQQIGSTYFDISLPYTLVYLPLNLIPIYIGLRYLGKHFTVYSVYVILLSSFLTDMMPAFTITYDVLLICIFGGIINGAAISLCLYVGASGGGTDFISIYFSQKKGIDTWNYIFMANVCILITAGVLFGFDRALYSIIFQYTSTQIIQLLHKRYQKHTLLIITEQPSAIYGRIKAITNHDATHFKGIGCYEGTERNMLYSVVSSEEVNKVLAAILETDPGAFVNVMKTEQIGGWFYNRPND